MTDVQIMSGNSHGNAIFCALTLALCGWMGAASLRAETTETTPVFSDEEDEALDVELIKVAAAAGKARAQTRLADFFLAAGDFTNAVLWYRKAAEQGDLAAQLTLASCLITGRGAAKDPKEAARWLRLAADRIEKPVANAKLSAPSSIPATPQNGIPANAIIITKAGASTNAAAALPPQEPPPRAFTRVQRSAVLQATEPVLQETKPVLIPYSEPR